MKAKILGLGLLRVWAGIVVLVVVVAGLLAGFRLLQAPGEGEEATKAPTPTESPTRAPVRAPTPTESPTRAPVRLTVVTRIAPQEGEALRSRFLASDIAKSYGIVDVVFLKEDVSKWPIYAREGRADLFFHGGYVVYKDLCDKGYLKPIRDPEAISIATSIGAQIYRRADGSVCFIAVARTIYSYTVNTAFLSKYNLPEPTSWGDLLNPIYAKPLLAGEALVSFPKPSKSTTAARIMQMMLQKGWDEGWALLTVVGALSYIVESAEKARDDVALGVSGLAPTVLRYGIRAEEASGGKARFVAARGEVIPDITPVAIAVNTRNEEAALAFIKWLLSPEGQRALAELFLFLPYVKPEGTGLEEVYERVKGNIFDYNPEDAALWERAAMFYFEAAIADSDANTLLKRVWVKAVELYNRGVISGDELRSIALMLGSPLTITVEGRTVKFTKDYAMEINKRVAEDAGFRSAFMSSVKKAAIERYEGILRLLEARG
ncbi:MAG: ABC transporter substrate-binding protein [Acidilobaceae archaeon]